MAKPICLVSVLVRHIDGQIWEFQEALDARFNDYHVIVFPAKYDQSNMVEIEVIYDKDFTIAQFDEIKTLVMEKLYELAQEKQKRDEDKTKEKAEPIY